MAAASRCRRPAGEPRKTAETMKFHGRQCLRRVIEGVACISLDSLVNQGEVDDVMLVYVTMTVHGLGMAEYDGTTQAVQTTLNPL